VRFVTVAKGWLNWDTHGNNFNTLQKSLLPEFDQAYAALLEDLHQRGLLDRTLVIAMGEFGRTPKINGDAGRDHWPKVFSVCLAGAEVRGGQVIGASDATASEVKDRPVQVEDLLTTIYSRLSIDTTKEYHTPIGRPVKIVNGGEVISELF
jgi:uncharacterized protein (DUF1501 family)